MLPLVIFPNWVHSCWEKRWEQTTTINIAKIEYLPIIKHNNVDLHRSSPKIESEMKNSKCNLKQFKDEYCKFDGNWTNYLPKTEIPTSKDNYKILNEDLYISIKTHYSLIVTFYGCDVIPENFFDSRKVCEFQNQIQSYSTVFNNLCERNLLKACNELPHVQVDSSNSNLVYDWFIKDLTGQVGTDCHTAVARELPLLLHIQEFSDEEVSCCYHKQNKFNLFSFLTVATTTHRSEQTGEINIIGEIFHYLTQIPTPTGTLTSITVKPWTDLVPILNPSHAKYCGDVGLILPDLLQSSICPQRFSSPCIFSSISLLSKHATNAVVLPAQSRYSVVLGKPPGAVERLVDFQSSCVLMPVAKEVVHAGTASPINITPTLYALIPHTHIPPSALPVVGNKRKRNLIWLEGTSAAVSLAAHLSELELSGEDRQPRKKTRIRIRCGLAEFVETASMQVTPIAPQLYSVSEDPASLFSNTQTGRTEAAAQHVVESSSLIIPANATIKTTAATEDPVSVAASASALNPYPANQSKPTDSVTSPPTTNPSAPVARTLVYHNPPDTHHIGKLPSFLNESSDNMVEQYLRLQSGMELSVKPVQGSGLPGSAASRSRTAQPHKVTPQRHGSTTTTTTGATNNSSLPDDPVCNQPSASTAVPVSPQQSGTTKERITQLAAHNIDRFSCGTHPLRILVSESFLEEHYLAVGVLSSQYGVEMIDCPLEIPLSLIIDACTAVCVVSLSSIVDRSTLKVLVKQLSAVTFKFSYIYIVVLLPTNSNSFGTAIQNQALLTLCQALARFPAQVALRQCPTQSDTLAFMLSQVCKQCLRDAVHGSRATSNAATPTVEHYFERPFLQHLQVGDPRFQMHCEFLQLFPTMNIFIASALLHHFPLRELCMKKLQDLREVFNRHYILNEEVEIALKGFVGLLKEPFQHITT